ncbi:Hypothetical predicted protein [Cloeon dipterum]|uniref:TGF-beta family profile domain-containing protein n=1 Tax=Cloeon dipterum TaxID=197152 RepID=A0A8S1BUQ3_9INSE|nr:Hypothetical predicted protein [Cloeon dipterum]
MICFKAILLFGALISPLVTATISGVYEDTGIQNMLVRSLSQEEQTAVGGNVLQMMGLPEVPNGDQHGHDSQAAAPKFLLDVYKTLLDEEQHKSNRQTEFEMTMTDIHAMHESDVVMSFTTQDPPRVVLRHQKEQRLWFNVSQVPEGDSLMAAELRIYKSQVQLKNKKIENFNLVLNMLVPLADGEGLEKILEVPINSHSDGWILFNVTGALDKWIQDDESNLGLYINVVRQNTSKHVKPEYAGIQLTGTEKQPFMVAFLKADINLNPSEDYPSLDAEEEIELENEFENLDTLEKRRSKRDTKKIKQAGSSQVSHYDPIKSFVPESNHRPENACQLRTMFVNFADLNWNQWIIAPDGYAAFYCYGDCKFPLTSHMNATNHAIVQTLVHLINPVAVPTPCCAPTKLSEISVLYYMDASANVFLKRFKNMVVKACGCQ